METLAQETSSPKETGRLEAFSDGVFAIAITLLVLDLKVPRLEEPVSSEKLLASLADQWPSYFPFLTSFATILIMWISHHNLFKLIYKSDNLFMFANGLLLLMVTFVPFPTGVVADYLTTPAAPAACAFYAAIFVVINLIYNFFWWSAAYHRRLLKSAISTVTVKRISRSFLLGLPGYLAATIVAWWSPVISILICAVMWVFWAFTRYDEAKNTERR